MLPRFSNDKNIALAPCCQGLSRLRAVSHKNDRAKRLPQIFNLYSSPSGRKRRCLRQLNPFIEIIIIQTRAGGCDFLINDLSVVIDFPDNNAFVQNGGPFAHEQKSVGLFPCDYFVQAGGSIGLFCHGCIPA